jgi:hypothetical protein
MSTVQLSASVAGRTRAKVVTTTPGRSQAREPEALLQGVDCGGRGKVSLSMKVSLSW